MRFFIVSILCSIIFLSACSIPKEEIEQLSLNYWNKEVSSMVLYPEEDSKEIQLFIDALNNSELLHDKVIMTEPLLSFNIDLADEKEKNYHLWILTNGEGYIQQLHPDENKTLQIDSSVAIALHNYFKKQDDVELINTEIEFEKD